LDPLLELSYVLGADIVLAAVSCKTIAKEFDPLGRADTTLLMINHQMKLASQIINRSKRGSLTFRDTLASNTV
jgi:hypothetical protein